MSLRQLIKLISNILPLKMLPCSWARLWRWERLQVEKRSQATPARVERLAREKLQMRQVSPGITMYLGSGDAAQQQP